MINFAYIEVEKAVKVGFQDYQVQLEPKHCSFFATHGSTTEVAKIAEEIQENWPQISVDTEVALHPTKMALAFKSEQVLFQILVSVRLHSTNQPSILVSLRFTYCNPRNVYLPFCELAQWLMKRYNMSCHIQRIINLGPDEQVKPSVIENVNDLPDVLVSSMDYYRDEWRRLVTQEEAAIRPGEVLAWLRSLGLD